MRGFSTSVIIIVFCFCMQDLHAQIDIVASDTLGCDSLNTFVYLSPSAVFDTMDISAWYLNDLPVESFSDTLQLSIDSSGVYTIKVRFENQLEIMAPFYLEVADSPDADFFYRDTLSPNPLTLVFRACEDAINQDYYWYVSGNPAGNDPLMLYSFPAEGFYSVSLLVENSSGCSDSIYKSVSVRELLKKTNVFTPNMDGFNDFFEIKTDGIIVYSFQVYSRMGVKVYEIESPTISWDGRSLSGLQMSTGIYYYTLESVNSDYPVSISGFLHLIRD